MPWQVLIGISVLLYSISVLLQRTILRENESEPIAFSIFFQLLIGFLIALMGIAFGNMRFPSNLSPLFFNLLLMAILYGFANVLIFKSLKQVEASKFTILFSTRAIFTVAASSLLLNEALSSKQLFGALLIFFGIIIVNIKSQKFSIGKGEILALLAALAFGTANTNDRFLLLHLDKYFFTSLAFIVPALLIALVYPKEPKHIKLFLSKKVFPKILILCVFYSLSAITFFAALQTSSNSSQVASINLTSVVVIVVLSVIFLKERAGFAKKLLAAVLSFIGLLFLN